jgi:hypothetical protein
MAGGTTHHPSEMAVRAIRESPYCNQCLCSKRLRDRLCLDSSRPGVVVKVFEIDHPNHAGGCFCADTLASEAASRVVDGRRPDLRARSSGATHSRVRSRLRLDQHGNQNLPWPHGTRTIVSDSYAPYGEIPVGPADAPEPARPKVAWFTVPHVCKRFGWTASNFEEAQSLKFPAGGRRSTPGQYGGELIFREDALDQWVTTHGRRLPRSNACWQR